MLTRALEQLGQLLERFELALSQPLALVEQPLVVAPLEEVAGIGFDGISQSRESVASVGGVSPCERVVEGSDVEPERRVRPPLQSPLSHFQVAVSPRQRPPEVVKHVTKVRLCLRLGRIGPEEKGQTLSRLSGLAVEEVIREQRLCAGRIEPRQGRLAELKSELAEEPDREQSRIARRRNGADSHSCRIFAPNAGRVWSGEEPAIDVVQIGGVEVGLDPFVADGEEPAG